MRFLRLSISRLATDVPCFPRVDRVGACARPSPRCCAASARPTASAPGGTSFGDDRSGRGVGAVADRHRRDQAVVAAHADVVADRGAVLVRPVVVDDDRARADVAALADRGVADVGQVRHLGAVADLGVLDLDVGADLAAGAEHGAGPQVAERADGRVLADLRAGGVALEDGRALADLAVGQRGVRADDGVPSYNGVSVKLGVAARSVTSGSSTTSASIQVVAGSRTATPARMCARHDAVAQHPRELGELDAVVDAAGLVGVGGHLGLDRQPGVTVQADDVGEVLLALGVVGREPAERLAQRAGVEGVDAGRDLVDRVCASASLCSTTAVTARRVADDPAVAGRVLDRAVSSVVAAPARRVLRRPAAAASRRSAAGRRRGRPRRCPRACSRVSRATRTAWPVPSWVSWTTARALPVRVAVTCSRAWPTTTSRWSGSSASAAASTWPSMVRPPSACRTFGVALRIRVPSPAARTIDGGRSRGTNGPRLQRRSERRAADMPGPCLPGAGLDVDSVQAPRELRLDFEPQRPRPPKGPVLPLHHGGRCAVWHP